MQAGIKEKTLQTLKKEQTPGDKARVKRLVEAAAMKCGEFKKLAEVLNVHPQLISNWRNGIKTPSPEAQAEMAQIAGHNVPIASLMALIEKSDGARKMRLQAAYRDWAAVAAANVEQRKNADYDPKVALIEKVIEGLDQNDQTQADAAKMLRALVDAFANAEWRRL